VRQHGVSPVTLEEVVGVLEPNYDGGYWRPLTVSGSYCIVRYNIAGVNPYPNTILFVASGIILDPAKPARCVLQVQSGL
jgi:hypothetical protein